MNTPDPPHWTLNYHFAAFRTIWVHFGLFGCLTKLGAKRAELVQKFVPRSCIGIFHNERTRSTPLDPKLMCLVSLLPFRCIWDRLVVLQTRCKSGRTSAKLRATKSHRNFLQRTHLIHLIGHYTDVFVHFVLFGWIWDRWVALRNLVHNGPN